MSRTVPRRHTSTTEPGVGWGVGNNGFGHTTNSGATNSGFGDTGTGDSGFFNTASGGSQFNGGMSGFFNTGVTGPIGTNPSGQTSGFDSGVLNTGTGVAGWLNLYSLW